MRNAGLDVTQAGIKIAGRSINNLRYADDTTLMAKGKKNSRAFWWKWKRKNWLKTQHSKNEDHGIWSHHSMANRWETTKTVTDFIFLGPKSLQMVTVSHEIKRHLLLGRKAMRNLDSVWKSRAITLPARVHLIKAMVFPEVRYECESWTIKKVERWRIDAFALWCWRRLLRVLWAARGSNQSILKEIRPEYSLEDWC